MKSILYVTVLFMIFLKFVVSSPACDRSNLDHNTEELKDIIMKKYTSKTPEDLDGKCRHLEQKLWEVVQTASSCNEKPDSFVTEKVFPAYIICMYERKEKEIYSLENALSEKLEICNVTILQKAINELELILHPRSKKSRLSNEERGYLCSAMEHTLLTVVQQTEACNEELNVFITDRAIPAYFECVYVYGHTSRDEEAKCKYSILESFIGCREITEIHDDELASKCSTIDEITTCARNRSEANCKGKWKYTKMVTSLWLKSLRSKCSITGNAEENIEKCHQCPGVDFFEQSELIKGTLPTSLNDVCNRFYEGKDCLSIPIESCPVEKQDNLQQLQLHGNDFLIRLCLPGSKARNDFINGLRCILEFNLEQLWDSCKPKTSTGGKTLGESICRSSYLAIRCLSSKIEVLCGVKSKMAFDDHTFLIKDLMEMKCWDGNPPTEDENKLQ